MLAVGFHCMAVEEQLPSLTRRPTAWQTWQTLNVTLTYCRMLRSLPRSLFLACSRSFWHWRVQGWFSCELIIFLMCFVCLLAKQHATFKWKDATSGFPVSPGSAEVFHHPHATVTARFHYASWFGACSELVWSWFVTNSITLAGSELAPNRFGAC